MRSRFDAAGGTTTGGLGSGLVGALLAGLVLCPPVLAVLLGLGGSAFLVSLEAYQTELRLGAGLALTLIVAWWTLWRPAPEGVHSRPIPVLLVAVGAFAVAYLALVSVAIPLLHEIYHGIVPHQR